jgi:serpin B
MKKVSFILVICLLLSSITGCADLGGNVAIDSASTLKKIHIDDGKVDEKIINSINNIGIDVMKNASEEGDNVITSPLSLAVVLTILANGAEGDTKKELESIINPSNISREQLNDQYCLLLNMLNDSGYEENNKKTTMINTANSLWTSKDFSLKDDFIKNCTSYYDAGIYNVDFHNKNTLSTINQWISDKTSGKIKDYLKNINPGTVMYIFNSLYFKGKWQDEFSKKNTKSEDFYLKDGSKKKVKMMNAERQMSSYEDDDIVAGNLNYYGCSMQLVVPKGDIDKYIEALDYQKLQENLKNSEYVKTKIKLPKFQYEGEYSYKKILQKLGVNKTFAMDDANFSYISDDKPLFVNDISQKCVIDVDEEGTEAAALTTVHLCGAAQPPEKIIELYADRPFIYFIKHGRTGALMFAGVVYEP